MFLFIGLGILFERRQICAGTAVSFARGVSGECQMIFEEKSNLHWSLVVDKAVTLHRGMVIAVLIRACGVTHRRWL